MSNYSKDQSQFEHLWNEPYSFNLGGYIRQAFGMLKAFPFGYLGHILLTIFATVIIALISSMTTALALGQSTVVGLILNQLVGWFIGAFSLSMMSGIFIVADNYRRENRRSFDGFFHGINHFGQLFLYSATVGAVFSIIALISMKIVNLDFNAFDFSALSEGDFDPDDFPALLDSLQAAITPEFVMKLSAFGGLLSLLSLYFRVSWSFSVPMIVLKKMRFWEAMESSRKIITKKWFHFLGLYVVLMFIAIAGIIGFAFVTDFLVDVVNFGWLKGLFTFILIMLVMLFIPFVYLGQYSAFDDIVLAGTEGMDEIHEMPEDEEPEDLI
ncbi:MAG: hypothetical protein MRZ79_20650 [Bacteroidia bacterium]|nr:hypothetical protein [Bacteroidia bacterium]